MSQSALQPVEDPAAPAPITSIWGRRIWRPPSLAASLRTRKRSPVFAMGVVRRRTGELHMADHTGDFFAPSSCRYDFLLAAAEEDHAEESLTSLIISFGTGGDSWSRGTQSSSTLGMGAWLSRTLNGTKRAWRRSGRPGLHKPMRSTSKLRNISV
ncbi:uncharacterized protein LOC124700211 [Lolium rigidum]|uniref:uncharacterized protein LOC124700211 n=1 Tax=Lolium rigidum TaxID=89674 RepID=UPI001F5D0A02|nr:uncharacterized protein LOC124700211 [Lolium rigidum]